MVHTLLMLGGLAFAAHSSGSSGAQSATDSPSAQVPLAEPQVELLPLQQPRFGLGLGHGGGGVLGLHFNAYLPQQFTVDLGLHWRVISLDNRGYSAAALTLGLNREHGSRAVRPGYFAKIGTAGGAQDYRESFLAAGVHLGLWTPNQRHTFTVELGPGVFVQRRIPNYNPGPPLLWLWRLSWHLNVGKGAVLERATPRDR